MALTPFTAYIGEHARWVEIRPVYLLPPTAPEQLPDEYIIYSNDKRNAIGELQIEANQDSSILGTFSFLDKTVSLNDHQFTGQATLESAELRDIANAIKQMIMAVANEAGRR
jgi:hypothetical protein